MCSVSGYELGGDRQTLMDIYSALIRTTIDYGCIVYGIATKTASEAAQNPVYSFRDMYWCI
jgi:hypothetical protein